MNDKDEYECYCDCRDEGREMAKKCYIKVLKDNPSLQRSTLLPLTPKQREKKVNKIVKKLRGDYHNK